MLLNWLKERNLNSKIDKKVGRKPTKKVLKNSSNSIQSVLILSDESCEDNIETSFNKALNFDKVTKKVFVTKLNKGEVNEKLFSKKDISTFGKFKTERLKQLVTIEYDLLINYSIDNLYLKYITVNSKSKFKVGFSDCDERLYDLMIQVNIEEQEVFISELKKYLKILNKI